MLRRIFFLYTVLFSLLLFGVQKECFSSVSVGNASVTIFGSTNPVEEFSSATVLDYGDGEKGISVKLPGRTQSYILSKPLGFMPGWSASIDDSNTVTVASPDDLKYIYKAPSYKIDSIKNAEDANVVVFEYNGQGLISKQKDGFDPNLCIEYGYDGNLLTTLTACDYNDCREYTIIYDSNNRAIASSSSCESCGGSGRFQYEYDAAGLLKKVKYANDPNVVIYEYVYNSAGWVTDIYLGEANDGDHFREFLYADNDDGSYIVDIYDYIDANSYRVTRDYKNSAGIVTKRIRCESLNEEDPNDPVGDSFTEHFVYESDANGIVVKKTVIPPSANLSDPPTPPISGVIRKEYTYDPNSGRLLTEKWFNANDANFTVISYTYEHTPDGKNVRIKYSTDARGAQTEYFYDGNSVDPNLTAMPQVTSGISGTQQLKYEYGYDSRNRMILEKQLDINDVVLVQTKYKYDNYGNLVKRRDDYGGSNEEITEYKYNGFNEMTRMKLPSGVVSGRRYNSSGKLESEFVLADGNDFSEPNDFLLELISQTKYSYDSNGRIKKMSRAKNDGVFDFNSPSSWVETEYEYDLRGNRIKVIEDVGGLALETTYEYNNQGQVTKVTLPNGKWTKTVRDGRGLVAKTIVGYGATTVATTWFYYDANRNLERQKSPIGIWTEYEYDDFDRLIKLTKGL